MKDLITYSKQLFRSLREPKSALLLIIILHVIALYIYEDWMITREIKHGYMNSTYQGAVLLIAAFALWLDRPWGYIVAILPSGYMFYVLARWVSGLHGDALAFRADRSVIWGNVRRWWYGMLMDKPEYIIQVILAALIFCYATSCLIGYLSRKQT